MAHHRPFLQGLRLHLFAPAHPAPRQVRYGRDHIASPCSHEGESFEPGANWWEPAVEVLPEAAEKAATDLVVGPPAKGTGP